MALTKEKLKQLLRKEVIMAHNLFWFAVCVITMALTAVICIGAIAFMFMSPILGYGLHGHSAWWFLIWIGIYPACRLALPFWKYVDRFTQRLMGKKEISYE